MIARTWSRSLPCGLRARFALTPSSQAFASASPWLAMMEATNAML
ncbi:Uncharacterised protein [Vibrio cholerae]|nr:Uncharacterised protein [Vibrio cholerae]CSI56756.1 Uncharacterised protein [Vibrio cholerae]CSI79626.1 Uncharacterised protein [Vibrio cholerae]